MAAFAHWRLKDSKTAAEYLQHMELNHLTAGQQVIFAVIARDTDTSNARDAAVSVLRTIDPKARMLPEERVLLERARR